MSETAIMTEIDKCKADIDRHTVLCENKATRCPIDFINRDHAIQKLHDLRRESWRTNKPIPSAPHSPGGR